MWGKASETTLHPLKMLLNKATCTMTFAPFGGPLDLQPIYQELGIFSKHRLKCFIQLQLRTLIHCVQM